MTSKSWALSTRSWVMRAPSCARATGCSKAAPIPAPTAASRGISEARRADTRRHSPVPRTVQPSGISKLRDARIAFDADELRQVELRRRDGLLRAQVRGDHVPDP